MRDEVRGPTWRLIKKGDSRITIVPEPALSLQGSASDSASTMTIDVTPKPVSEKTMAAHSTISIGSLVLLTLFKEVEELKVNESAAVWTVTRTTVSLGSLIVFKSAVRKLERR
jgi:hypothetical protein